MIEAYNIKLKKMTEMENPKLIYFKNGTPAWQGKCKETGITIQRMLKREEKAELKTQQTRTEQEPTGEQNAEQS